jgi:NADPH-dependent curcumin reductase CurA
VPYRSREVRLSSRPVGEPVEDNFSVVEREVPDPVDGQVVVRNIVMSVDPYMRGRMNDVKSYVPPFQVGEPLEGGAVGEVVAARSPKLAEGDVVLHGLGWREYAIFDADQVGVRRLDPAPGVPLSAYLGVLGMPGHTAYVGLLEIATMKPGDVVFVSGAAGAVGSLAGQIARLRGAERVVGSAGSDEKVNHIVKDLRFDDAFNYHTAPIPDQLATAAPNGIDVYFDNVGGAHLEAALSAMRTHGRVAVCGAISLYNSVDPPPGPRNLALLIRRRISMRGFLVFDHNDRYDDFVRDVGTWLACGDIVFRETFRDGIENAPGAFLGLLRGDNTGKMLVRLG